MTKDAISPGFAEHADRIQRPMSSQVIEVFQAKSGPCPIIKSLVGKEPVWSIHTELLSAGSRTNVTKLTLVICKVWQKARWHQPAVWQVPTDPMPWRLWSRPAYLRAVVREIKTNKTYIYDRISLTGHVSHLFVQFFIRFGLNLIRNCLKDSCRRGHGHWQTLGSNQYFWQNGQKYCRCQQLDISLGYK